MLVFFYVTDSGAQKNYRVHFNIGEFTFNNNSQGEVNIVGADLEFFFLEDTLLPALPYTTKNILIPRNAKIKDLKFEITEGQTISNVLLPSNPPVYVYSEMAIPDEPNYLTIFSSGQYPTENIAFMSLNKMQDLTYASFLICPFKYDAEENKLTLITDFEIDITYDLEIVESFQSVNRERLDFYDIIKDIIINSDEISELYPKSTNILKRNTTIDDIEYLIVTSDELVESFLPLKAWKTQKGKKVDIVSTNYIYSSYSGTTNTLKIKNCLHDYYLNRNLKYVLLGGDDTVVPVQGCYGQLTDIIDETIPTDLFYACFDNNFEWNAYGNNIIGETTDNIDMSPEIFLTRAPVRNTDHVNAFVNKSIQYEKSTPSSGALNKMLLSGNKLYEYWDHLQISDAHFQSESMYNVQIAPYWTGIKYKFYDTGTDFNGGPNYDLTAQNLQEKLDSGYHFIHMATHGSQLGWKMETGNYFNTDNALVLKNTNHSIIATIACNTNAFDNKKYKADPCFSEALIRNPVGGAVAFIGPSRYGVGNAAWEHSFYFFNSLYKGQPFDHSYKFGAVVSASKERLVSRSGLNGPNGYRWMQFALNPIGDPELSIFTDNPSFFSNVTGFLSNSNLTVNTGGVSECTIAVTSKDYGNTYFQVGKNVEETFFTGVNTPVNITITKHNYKPSTFPNNLFVQNNEFSLNTELKAENIYVGGNVTPELPLGNVIVKNGVNVTFDIEQSIILNAGFEVELGGTFEVQL